MQAKPTPGPFTVFRTSDGAIVGTRAGRRYQAHRQGSTWACAVMLASNRRILHQAWLPSEAAAYAWLAAQSKRHEASRHTGVKHIFKARP